MLNGQNGEDIFFSGLGDELKSKHGNTKRCCLVHYAESGLFSIAIYAVIFCRGQWRTQDFRLRGANDDQLKISNIILLLCIYIILMLFIHIINGKRENALHLNRYKIFKYIKHEATNILYQKSYHNYKRNLLQLPSTVLHVLKALHDSLIINAIKYVLFYIKKQTIIHPLIRHSVA